MPLKLSFLDVPLHVPSPGRLSRAIVGPVHIGPTDSRLKNGKMAFSLCKVRHGERRSAVAALIAGKPPPDIKLTYSIA